MYLTYKFVNETVEIEVPEKWIVEIRELEREAYNSDQRACYRNRKFLEANCRSYNRYYIPMPVPAEVERRERVASLNHAISQLLPEQQKLIWQRYIQEIPATEIARRDGVSKSAISHRVGRALYQLKKILTA